MIHHFLNPLLACFREPAPTPENELNAAANAWEAGADLSAAAAEAAAVAAAAHTCAAQRLFPALLERDEQALHTALATLTSSQLEAVREPMPLYHAAALAGWEEGVLALAAAGVSLATADALVPVVPGSLLAISLLPRLQGYCFHCPKAEPNSPRPSDPVCHMSAVGIAAAFGHRAAAAALLAAGASASNSDSAYGGPAGRCNHLSPAYFAACVRAFDPAMLQLLESAGGGITPAQAAHAVRYVSAKLASTPLLLRQLAARPASTAGLESDELHTLAHAAVVWECPDFLRILPAEVAARCLPTAAALGKASVVLALLQQSLRSLGTMPEQAISAALAGRQQAALTALLRAGALPSAAHISQAVCSCQPQALRAMLAVAHPQEPPPRFGTIDLRSADFASQLPGILHQALLSPAEVRRMPGQGAATQGGTFRLHFMHSTKACSLGQLPSGTLTVLQGFITCLCCQVVPYFYPYFNFQASQPGTPVKRLQVVEALVAAGYRLSAYHSVLVRLPGGAERRYDRFDPATDDPFIAAVPGSRWVGG